MNRIFMPLVLGILALLPAGARAQYYYENDRYYNSDMVFEIGGGVGMMNALTDLGGKKGIGKSFIKDLTLKTSKPCYSVYAVGTYKGAIGIRAQVTFGRIAAYDSILKPVGNTTFLRYERNLSFRSNIRDISLVAEVHPLFFKTYEENESPYFSPYLVAGIGFFNFEPEAQLDGRWHSLQSLHLEGQGWKEYPDRKEYSLSQVNIPLGIGIRYELSSVLNARLEFIHRLLFTDYLDDVSESAYVDPALFYTHMPAAQATIAERLSNRSGAFYKDRQRGNPKDNDSFFTVQLKLGFVIRSRQR